ncbi:hypothetical protein K431DRAFT_42552 [Polychaeton citri CBS 116435]|uniref:Uncharacterized protein n=1 Tax=Polychaeton citri CBS 116435 TaxID=1314669 RepID=A0A9P4QAZ1_9PEZI|nr:hypothetical protein K431DRAFT_42552 [Polychaeton citri CBS 116435]
MRLRSFDRPRSHRTVSPPLCCNEVKIAAPLNRHPPPSRSSSASLSLLCSLLSSDDAHLFTQSRITAFVLSQQHVQPDALRIPLRQCTPLLAPLPSWELLGERVPSRYSMLPCYHATMLPRPLASGQGCRMPCGSATLPQGSERGREREREGEGGGRGGNAQYLVLGTSLVFCGDNLLRHLRRRRALLYLSLSLSLSPSLLQQRYIRLALVCMGPRYITSMGPTLSPPHLVSKRGSLAWASFICYHYYICHCLPLFRTSSHAF